MLIVGIKTNWLQHLLGSGIPPVNEQCLSIPLMSKIGVAIECRKIEKVPPEAHPVILVVRIDSSTRWLPKRSFHDAIVPLLRYEKSLQALESGPEVEWNHAAEKSESVLDQGHTGHS